MLSKLSKNQRTLHVGRRCHLREERKLHPVGWQLDDLRSIRRVRWRRCENAWNFSESFCRHPRQSIVLCFQTEAETWLQALKSCFHCYHFAYAGAMWIGGNLTMKKNKLFIRHATANIGGAYQQSWSHIESSPSFLSVCKWIQIGSCRALPNFLCHPTMCVFFPLPGR